MNVKEFVLTYYIYTKNTGEKWKIDGIVFDSIESIPANLMELNIFDWAVNQLEGIIEINTKI